MEASSSSLLQVREEEHADLLRQNGDRRRPRRDSNPMSSVSYRINVFFCGGGSTEMRDDVWSCFVVLATFWFFASMTLILGFYGSVGLVLGPNSSRLIRASPFFVQSIKAQEVDDARPGAMLYGFYDPPPLDVETTWSETHQVSIAPDLHEEWIYFLNRGSKVDISYRVESSSSSPLSLVIAQGRESLVRWVEDPSYPNTTLSWNIIHGSGEVQQEIWKSANYYVAVGNLNFEDAQVQLNFSIKSFQYNTTQASYRCSLSQHACSVKLLTLRRSAAVLTSPGPEQFFQGIQNEVWNVKLSYGPRWISYFVGSGVMTVLILMACKICDMSQSTGGAGTGFRAGGMVSEQAPALKEDDLSSWGSSYDSASHSEEDLEEQFAVAYLEGQPLNEGENSSNPRRICIICFNAPRDCFFLPCGHCAACFSCATRIAEETGTCPICRRRMKKVRKIFTV